MIKIFINILRVGIDNFEKIYQKYKGIVYAVCYRILGNEHDAYDASQEAFLKLSKNMHLLKNKALEQAWVISAARCASFDLIKKEKQMPQEVGLDQLEPYLPVKEKSPEELVLGEEAVNRIYDTIKTLDPKYATVLIYRYYFDLKQAEIAEISGLKLNTVSTRLRRGTELLRNALHENAEQRKEAKI